MISFEEAERILEDCRSEKNAGWIAHSIYVGRAAAALAEHLPGISSERALVFGYLHDVGRKFGDFQMNHAIFGYRYLMELGDAEAAGICLTHSFPIRDIRSVVDYWDLTREDYDFLAAYLRERPYSLCDKMIQLCDSMATSEGIVAIECRMMDIMRRYGIRENTMPRWERLFALKAELEREMGRTVEEIFGLQTRVCLERGAHDGFV